MQSINFRINTDKIAESFKFVNQFKVKQPVESAWDEKYSIREQGGNYFPIDRESLEKILPHCLFIEIMAKLCLPASQEAVQPKPGKQRAVTLTVLRPKRRQIPIKKVR